jgi:RNA polymerase sigma factor (sigma-70 family)
MAFQAVESRLRQYLFRFFVRREDVEDMVQETFLRAYESERTQKIRLPKAFLFRIARNLALSEIARKSNLLTICMGDLDDLEVMDSRISPEADLEIDRQIDALCRIAESLPPQCRRVLVMRKVLGFSHQEIARRMNISARTVEKHLTKALQRCQEAHREEQGRAARQSRQIGRREGG